MNTQLLNRHFAKIGARVVFGQNRLRTNNLQIDIGNDREGEFFDIAGGRQELSQLEVIDTQPRMRHLLLMSRDSNKSKFLCGHDERHWFVAGVPGGSVSSVKTAFESLKPQIVRWSERQQRVKPRLKNRRKNPVFIRQGEWFFLPWDRPVDARWILRNEPISRTGGKPHMCEELVRTGGQEVYVSAQYRNGLTPQAYRSLLSRRPKLRSLNWVVQRLNPDVLIRGKVRHPDHKTIVLNGWHRVAMNTEHESPSMRHIAFLD